MEKKLWVVHDSSEGIVCVHDDFEIALKEYEKCKADQEFMVADGEGFEGDERVILAEVKRDYRVVDTEDPILKVDDNGNEYKTGGNYFAFREFITK